MADEIDLYADFDFAPPSVSCSTATSAVSADGGASELARRSAKEVDLGGDIGLDLYGDLEGPTSAAADDGEDNEAVSALLELLCAAEDFNDGDPPLAAGDAELDAGPPGDAFLLSVDSIDSEPPQKRRRPDAEAAVPNAAPTGAAEAAAAAGDAGFDFEADLTPRADRAQLCVLAPPKTSSGPGPPSSAASTPAKYWYNPATQRWEQGQLPPQAAAQPERWWSRAAAGRGAWSNGRWQQAAGRGRGAANTYQQAPARLKKYPCRYFAAGKCRWGDECYFSHAEEAMKRFQMNPELVKRHHIAQCAMEARSDVDQGICEYPQALAVRLALRFEERPEDMLASMAQAGLPAGSDQRTTVKALLRLCHPDKCRHPDAKKAVQVLGPLLGKAT